MTESQMKPNDAQQSANEIFALAVEERQERHRVIAEGARARSSVTRQRVVLACLAGGVPILIAVVMINVVGFSVTSLFESKPSASAARQEAQQTLDTLVDEIEEFRKDYDELPESLVEIGVPARGQWSYSVTGKNDYRVQGTLYGQGVSFDASTSAKRPMKDRQ